VRGAEARWHAFSLIALLQSLTDPRRVPPAIQHRMHVNPIVLHSVVDCKREALGKRTVVRESLGMNSSAMKEGINVREQLI
jgi:hypothetical protein